MSTDDWCTPRWLAELLGCFELDPCGNAKSHVKANIECRLDHTDATDPQHARRDGLAYDWGWSSVFVNPPYSRPMPWCERLRVHEGPWVALLKLDPTTRWWSALMAASPTVAPFRKRIKFEGQQSMTANFPSVLVYSAWRPNTELRAHLWLPTYTIGAKPT